MISEIPWTDGQKSFAQVSDDAAYVASCVSAIAKAGIDPADLCKFIEAVRAMTKHERYGLSIDDLVESFVAVKAAAACLPENKGGAE